MALDFTIDYSNHELLDNKHKYTKLYKLIPTDSSEVVKGDLLLVESVCGEHGLFIATSDSSDDGTLHLSKYLEFEFTQEA